MMDTVIPASLLVFLLFGVVEIGGALGLRETAPDEELIRIEEAWVRTAPSAGGNTAAYFRIINTGSTADYLVAAKAPAARMVELHTHIMDGGVARMRMVPRVELLPGETVEFRPGGLHVMLMGLTAPLAEGDTFVLTLVLEGAGEMELPVQARR